MTSEPKASIKPPESDSKPRKDKSDVVAAYDSSCIKIKEYATDNWSMAASLAEEFNGNEKLIQRGLVACELAGVCHSYYVDKYLRKQDIPINQDVSTIYAEQLKLDRQ